MIEVAIRFFVAGFVLGFVCAVFAITQGILHVS